jgi:iron complex outermembrane receptor protein
MSAAIAVGIAREDEGEFLMNAVSPTHARGLFLAGSAFGALCALVTASPVFAQQQSGSAPQTAPGMQATPEADQGLADIVVTAERREQSLQNVPISATVLTGDDLMSRGVTNIADLQQVAPSVAISTVTRSTFVNIRGVGIAQSSPTSNPGVAFYIDGQLLPHEMFIGQSFYDIGSVEVLRGPQGTLTGQNSTGGAIYVRTPEPRFDEFSGYVDQTVGTYDWFRTIAAVNIPFSDNVAIRVAGIHDSRDSFADNIAANARSTPGNVSLWAGRFNLAARSTDNRVRVNLRFDYFDSSTDGILLKRRNDIVSTDPFQIEEDARTYQIQRGYRLAGETRIAVTDGIEARGIIAFQHQGTFDQNDGDHSATALPQPPATNTGRVSRVETRYETTIGEVNLLSTGRAPVNWVVGAFYLTEGVRLLNRRDNRHTTDFVSSTATIDLTTYNDSRSLFGQVNWFVTDRLELIAGARHSWDQQDVNRFIVPGGGPAGTNPRGNQQSRQWTGRLGFNYHLNRTLFYATASRGYKAGGVNAGTTSPNYAPETNTVYETGFKSEFFGRHLRLNADIFYSDYQNIQFLATVGGLPTTQNAAAGRSYGGEVEVTGRFGHLGFNLGAGYLHGEFAKNACITNSFNPAGTPTSCPSVIPGRADSLVPQGQTLPYSPRWTINAGVQYAFDLGGGLTLTPRLQWSHLSNQVSSPFPSAFSLMPTRDVFDARLTLDIHDRYKIEAFATNFTDELYIASQVENASATDGGIAYGAPRQFGVRLVVNFGG